MRSLIIKKTSFNLPNNKQVENITLETKEKQNKEEIMKKVLGLVFILALFLTGCSDEGILRISNLDADYGWFTINDGLTEWLNPGHSYEKSYDLSTSIFGDEDKKVTVEYGGEYVFTERVTKTIKPGSRSSVEFETNAGEIIIWNDSDYFYIYEVYLSPSEDSSWGLNDLSGDIGPGESVTWNVTPGWWDILVVDDWGDEFYSFDNYISIEETLTFYYDGFKSGGDPIQLKIENAKKYTKQIVDRVQQKDK